MTNGLHGSKIAEFRERTACISCESSRLEVTDRGKFSEGPHRAMLLESEWGTSPFPYLEHCEWVLVRCEDCKQVFQQRVLSEEWDERRFREWMTDDAIARYEEAHGLRTPDARFEKARGHVEDLLKLEKTTRELRGGEALRVLDFGCGWGGFIGIARQFGCEASGLDRHTARREGAAGQAPIYASLDDFKASNPKPLHALTLFQVLEHLYSPMPILKLIHDLLSPGAVLLLEVPDGSSVTRIRTEADLAVIDGIDHLNAFSPETLTGIAKRAGFSLLNPGVAHVTTDLRSVAKREVRRMVDRLRKPTTQQYFRRD